jgi:hypothetical protein
MSMVALVVVTTGCGEAPRETAPMNPPSPPTNSNFVALAGQSSPTATSSVATSVAEIIDTSLTDSVPRQEERFPCVSENGFIPGPIVAADGQQVEATLSVYWFCGVSVGGHGDGPLMFGSPVALPATGQVAVSVPATFAVEIDWPGEPFVPLGDGSHVSAGAPPGCHRLHVDVTDPAGEAAASYGVDIAMRSAC